jgi:hypothetical protein
MQLSKFRTLVPGALLAATLALSGCTADPELADDLPDQGAAPTHVEAVTFPDTEVGNTSEWVVDEINGVRAINKQDWYPRVSPQLSEDIPIDSLVGTLNSQLRPSLPFVPSEYEEPETNYGVTRLTPDLTAQPIDLHIQVDDAGLITALWYEEVESDANGDSSFSDEDEQTQPGLGQ